MMEGVTLEVEEAELEIEEREGLNIAQLSAVVQTEEGPYWLFAPRLTTVMAGAS